MGLHKRGPYERSAHETRRSQHAVRLIELFWQPPPPPTLPGRKRRPFLSIMASLNYEIRRRRTFNIQGNILQTCSPVGRADAAAAPPRPRADRQGPENKITPENCITPKCVSADCMQMSASRRAESPAPFHRRRRPACRAQPLRLVATLAARR